MFLTVHPGGAAIRRRPLARTTCRPTAARTDSSEPITRTLRLARVTAV
jgi:hypothetical protein